MSETNQNTTNNINLFTDLALSPKIIKAVEEKGYTKPSPIQAQAIPAVLAGKDVMAAAQTGTGKTAGFVLPILEKLSSGESARSGHVRALIVSPTRELALQIQENITDYSKYLQISSAVVYGGANIRPQITKLRQGVDILVATPGRLLDLHQQGAVKFNDCKILVLDEADRMLDMGFIHDIKRIVNLLPKQRQNLLFSATFSQNIRQLAKGFVQHAVEVSVSTPNTTAKTVKQSIIPIDKRNKVACLIHLITTNNWHQVLVFARTKHGANKMAKTLADSGIKTLPIHGNKSQNAREKALKDFKAGKVQCLVATDVAARGIDIQFLPFVVNMDLPNVPEDYIHRIGRTGRAENKGEAISLVSADEAEQLRDIERLLKTHLQRNVIGGFEPEHDVPVTDLNKKAPSRGRGPGGGGGRPGGNSGNNSGKRSGGGNGRSGDDRRGSRSGSPSGKKPVFKNAGKKPASKRDA